jgi:hypothetical protein
MKPLRDTMLPLACLLLGVSLPFLISAIDLTDKKPGVIQATEFRLVDQNGDMRASLEMFDGSPRFKLYDEGQREKLSLEIDKEGNPALRMGGYSDDDTTINLVVYKNSGMIMIDSNSAGGQAMLGVSPNEFSQLFLRQAKAGQGTQFVADATDSLVTLQLDSPPGRSSVMLSKSTDGTGSLNISNAHSGDSLNCFVRGKGETSSLSFSHLGRDILDISANDSGAQAVILNETQTASWLAP